MSPNRRSLIASGLVSFAAPALVRAARAAPSAVTLKLHHASSSVSCVHASFLAPWARAIETQSGGRLRVDIFPSMQLGGQPAQLFDQARDGTADIVWAMPSRTPGRFPKIELFELPFVAPRRALVGSRAIEDFADEFLKDEFADIHPLCFSCADRGILHASRPIETIAEVAGLRLDVRTRFAAEAVAALGARALAVPSGQLQLAIARRVVDGCIIPWDMVPALHLDDILKAHTDFADDALSTTTYVLAMNKTAYEKLPPDLRRVIDDNCGQSAAGMAGAMWDLQAKSVADMTVERGDRVVTLAPEAVAHWRNATMPVTERWIKQMHARKVDGAKLLAGARALFAKYASLPEPQPPSAPAPPRSAQPAQLPRSVPPSQQSPAATSEVHPPIQGGGAATVAPSGHAASVTTPSPLPPVHVSAATPAPPVPGTAHQTQWWEFWKSKPAVAAGGHVGPSPQTAHWWQFWKSAAPSPSGVAPPAPVTASAPTAPAVPSPLGAMAKPAPAPASPPSSALNIPL